MATSDDPVIICKNEFISDLFARDNVYTVGVNASTEKRGITFFSMKYDINPGLAKTFPWLSQIAGNYEEYEFKTLKFVYKSDLTHIQTTGSSGTGAIGMLLLAANYNVETQPYQTKNEMIADVNHVMTGTPLENIRLHLECESIGQNTHGKYTRVKPLAPGQDVTDYDMAQVQLGLANLPASLYNQRLGELWVEYEVILSKPRNKNNEATNVKSDLYVTGQRNVPSSWPLGGVNGQLSGWYNTLETQLQVRQNNIDIFFPPWYNGAVEIIFTVAFTGVSDVMPYMLPATVRGPVGTVGIEDIYGACGYTLPVPETAIKPTYQLWGSLGAERRGTMEYKLHLKVVQPVPGGEPYTCVTLPLQVQALPSPATTITQACVLIQEYNATLSAAYQGFGSYEGVTMTDTTGKVYTISIDPLVPFSTPTTVVEEEVTVSKSELERLEDEMEHHHSHQHCDNESMSSANDSDNESMDGQEETRRPKKKKRLLNRLLHRSERNE